MEDRNLAIDIAMKGIGVTMVAQTTTPRLYVSPAEGLGCRNPIQTAPTNPRIADKITKGTQGT